MDIVIPAICMVLLTFVYLAAPIVTIVSICLRHKPVGVKLYFASSPIVCIEIAILLSEPVGLLLCKCLASFGVSAHLTDSTSIAVALALIMFYLSYKLLKAMFP